MVPCRVSASKYQLPFSVPCLSNPHRNAGFPAFIHRRPSIQRSPPGSCEPKTAVFRHMREFLLLHMAFRLFVRSPSLLSRMLVNNGKSATERRCISKPSPFSVMPVISRRIETHMRHGCNMVWNCGSICWSNEVMPMKPSGAYSTISWCLGKTGFEANRISPGRSRRHHAADDRKCATGTAVGAVPAPGTASTQSRPRR